MKKLLVIVLGVITIQFSQAQAPINTPDNIGSGNCLDFDGVSSNYISCGNIGSSSSGTTECWIKPGGDFKLGQWPMGGLNGSGHNVSMRHWMAFSWGGGTCGGNQWWSMLGNGSTFQVVCSGVLFDVTNFPSGVWTHLAVTYNGTNVKFYKDGVLVNTVAQTVSGAGNAQPYYIGHGNYKGQLDEARIWNIERTQAQIQNGMCQTMQGNETGLVGYWNMNEGTGNTVNDLTVNGNDGTLQ